MSDREPIARRLDAVDEELRGLLYALSHDLRSPLRTIDGFAEALAQDYGADLDDEARDHLRRIRAAASRMEQMIAALTVLARVSRGALARSAVDLTEIAEAVAAALRRSDPQRDVVFKITPGLAVEGDARLLRLAFQQLLTNSWKFTKVHPRAVIEIGRGERDGESVFYVRDDGAGFDSAYAGKLFIPFQRLHTRAEFEGDGIGLAMVRRIIHRHGGRVWAEGQVERGATIYLELP